MRIDKEVMRERAKYLNEVIRAKTEALRHAPEGALRVGNCRTGKTKDVEKAQSKLTGVQLYHRMEGGPPNGKYLSRKDRGLAFRLAQKDYDKKILCEARKELKAIEKYLVGCPDKRIEELFDALPAPRKTLVEPLEETEEQFAQRWCMVEYVGKRFLEGAPEYYTDRGERVRSKSEIIIANTLTNEGIPYRYEYPVELRGAGTVYPDFTILHLRQRREILWEHFGIMDDPEYAQRAVGKIYAYMRAGYYPGENLIMTWECSAQPLDGRTVRMVAERYCK